MNNYELIPRIVENKNWITIVFIVAIGVVTITKAVFEKRFTDFVRLLFNNKYIKVYKDPSNLMTWFTILLFFVQLISFSFFIQLVLSYYGYTTKTNWVSFIQIITFLTFFVLSKYLIEKIIATSFDTESFIEQFNLFKVSYRTYLGILLLPVDMVLYYTNSINQYVILGVLVIILIINAVTYLVSLRNYQNLLLRKLFYFILYICALEIAPYFFMYYYITNR
ncbi:MULTISPECIES: DUF4271 domain-containing protein [Flavobacterium]|uniref:DUF4271 domain-containing protein n=2 Tax=Flavobacterium TaxID=237 RepID=A0AA94F1N4_9FLAO|nr:MULTISPECIES: DUF4271 domain-containing protein [Flavobacterium]OXA77837.1 DUF4271 domain-containing protein [Flavobacterium columnare NBRC 100251 = ATCC 23463]AMA48214.1 hypothetical protein AWN65_01390 [Flavobacterium covae]AND63631.1 hypothetical protein AX766_04015 [Flavobacterium covae]MCH4830130.1 DUF4271 domain-containing protein [Flavobacterium columnare]MCH4832490.1 DUF4271 domain-containing protein [Flavobacterium columnare]